jgi:hypothetical protein
MLRHGRSLPLPLRYVPTWRAKRHLSRIKCGEMSAPIAILTPSLRYLRPYRAKELGQCATDSKRMSSLLHIQECSMMNMAWSRMQFGPSSRISITWGQTRPEIRPDPRRAEAMAGGTVVVSTMQL